jgi:hypothetical protein
MYGDESGVCMGWCPYPIAMARMGMGEELAAELPNVLSTWQFYPQGFQNYGPYAVYVHDRDERWATNAVREAETNQRFDFPKWNFRHFDNEPGPILATAVSEMMLQSHEGLIRLFGAKPAAWSASFRLAASGNFVVNAGAGPDGPAWSCVESRSGGVCRVADAWEGAEVWMAAIAPDGTASPSVRLQAEPVRSDRVFSFPTEKGWRYLLGASPDALSEWEVVPARYERNRSFKRCGDARLGLPRQF